MLDVGHEPSTSNYAFDKVKTLNSLNNPLCGKHIC